MLNRYKYKLFREKKLNNIDIKLIIQWSMEWYTIFLYYFILSPLCIN